MTRSIRMSAVVAALVALTVLGAGALAAGTVAAQEMTEDGMIDGDAMTTETETMGNETTTEGSMEGESMDDGSMPGESMDDGSMADDATETGGQPGFGVALGIAALAAAAGIGLYRRHG